MCLAIGWRRGRQLFVLFSCLSMFDACACQSFSGELPYITRDVQVKDDSDSTGFKVELEFPDGPNISDFETWQVQYRKATEQNWLVAMFSINSTSAQVNLSASGPYTFQVSAVEMAATGQVSAAQVLQICKCAHQYSGQN